jgi:hypothetical protein
MSAFTAKPPGMREAGGFALAPQTIPSVVGAVEPESNARHALRPRTSSRRGRPGPRVQSLHPRRIAP